MSEDPISDSKAVRVFCLTCNEFVYAHINFNKAECPYCKNWVINGDSHPTNHNLIKKVIARPLAWLLMKWFTRKINSNLKLFLDNNYVIHMTETGYEAHTQDTMCKICCHKCDLTEFNPDRWTLYADKRERDFLNKETDPL